MRWPSWTATYAGERDLGRASGRGDALLHRGVVGESGESLQRVDVVERSLAERRADDPRQSRIALDQPAAEGDAVGLVDDAARIDGVQAVKHGLAHQVRMQGRNAVDLVRADEGEIAHPDAPARVLVDQRDRGEKARIDEAAPSRAVEMRRIEQIDDLHVARQQALHQRNRPALERFGQEGVVRIGERRLRHLPRLVPFEAVEVDQNAHELGDGDRRMGVVELDCGVLADRAHVLVLLDVAADEVEKRRGGEKILLPEAQLLAGRGGVARIENLRDRFGAHRVRQRADEVAGVEGVELERIGRARRP